LHDNLKKVLWQLAMTTIEFKDTLNTLERQSEFNPNGSPDDYH